MKDPHLHVVSFDIPYPANYGGVIDVFYRIKALSEEGVRIHLHCYHEDRHQAPELRKYCEEVYYYPRKSKFSALPVQEPYIVRSRRSKQLLERLLKDGHPILFEGLHTCYYLNHSYLEFRQKMVRMHNVEWEYYEQLSQRETKWSKKQYLYREAKLLKDYERILLHADHLFTISPNDTLYYQNGHRGTTYIPAFHQHEKVSSKIGKGDYCIYHGKLSVAENHEAAMFLIKEVFSDIDYPLIIAGSEPLPELILAISEYPNITLRHNPDDDDMLTLMQDAHIHILPTFQSTGIKLKLLNALYAGRFCIATPAMVNNTGLETCCVLAQDLAELKGLICHLAKFSFSESEIQHRQEILQKDFSNKRNAQKIIDLLEADQ